MCFLYVINIFIFYSFTIQPTPVVDAEDEEVEEAGDIKVEDQNGDANSEDSAADSPDKPVKRPAPGPVAAAPVKKKNKPNSGDAL